MGKTEKKLLRNLIITAGALNGEKIVVDLAACARISPQRVCRIVHATCKLANPCAYRDLAAKNNGRPPAITQLLAAWSSFLIDPTGLLRVAIAADDGGYASKPWACLPKTIRQAAAEELDDLFAAMDGG